MCGTPVDVAGIGDPVDSLSLAAVTAEMQPARISGEVAALSNDAREAVSSGLPESTGGSVDLAHIGRGPMLRQGPAIGMCFLSLRSALADWVHGDRQEISRILVERKPDSQ